MPFIVPFIPLIAAAATAGTSLYEGSQARGAAHDAQNAQKEAARQAAEKQAQQESDARRKMLAGNLPSAVSQTGGYLTNLGDLGLAGAISGLPGAPYTGSGQGALGQFLGNQSSAGGGDMMGALHQLTPQGLGGQPDPTALPFPGMNMVNQTYGISGGSA